MFKIDESFVEKIIDYGRRYDFVFENVDFGFLVSHPFTDCTRKYINKNLGIEKIDLAVPLEECFLDLTKKDEREEYYTWLKKNLIEEDYNRVLWAFISKPYRLNFLKFTYNYMEKNGLDVNYEELARLFIDCYEVIEMPYQDKETIEFFYYLFEENNIDVQKYSTEFKLPSGKFKVYRGQSKDIKDFNISWTTDIKVAEMFAKRWKAKGKGKITTIEIDDYFVWYVSDNRNESEVVLKPGLLDCIDEMIVSEEFV